jgi:hypothetical protein
MKKIKQNLLISFVLLTILISCSNSGAGPDFYYGIWENSENVITITPGGKANYYVKFKHIDNGVVAEYDCYTFNNGKLCINGSPLISYSGGKLIYNGDEYEKLK